MNCILEWISALGTLGATIAAVWFGICGNRETRILVKKITNNLDRDAFIFLSEIPGIVEEDRRSRFREKLTQKHIDQFSKLITANSFIESKEMNKYKSYIDWATKYLESNYSDKNSDQKSLFYQIKTSTYNLSNQVDTETRTSGINKILDHESNLYWDKKVFYLYPDPEDPNIDPYLIYTTDAYEARKILGEINEIYRNENKIHIDIESPLEYELKEKKADYIQLIIRNKNLTLYLDRPIIHFKKSL